MTAISLALPAGPGAPVCDPFPTDARNRLRYDFGLVLNELRARSAALMSLAAGPWLVLIAIASRWQGHAEAWPSQETIGAFCGCSSRSVRRYVLDLERAGLLRLRRTHQPNGHERIYYAPGFVLLRELTLVEERYPRDRMRKAIRATAETSADVETPDTVTAEPPDTVAGELSDQDLEPTSSCGSAHDAAAPSDPEPTAAPTEHETEEEGSVFDPASVTPEQAPASPTPRVAAPRIEAEVAVVREDEAEPTDDDRAVARVILGERLARKYPDRALPRWFDRSDVEQVARCTMLLDGDRDAKIAAHRGALAAAFAASKSGPPTVKFIWGSIEHFLGHVERGRALEKKRVALEIRRVEVPSTTSTPCPPPSAEERAKMREDIARLFGNGFARPNFARDEITTSPR